MSEADQQGLSPEDFAAVAAWFQQQSSPEGTLRREIINAGRPDWPTLGRTLLDFAQTVLCAARTTPPIDNPQPFSALCPTDNITARVDSPAANDRDANLHPNVNPRNELVMNAVLEQFTAAIDHINGLGILLSANCPIRPAFASARAILLVGARLSWLAAPGIECDTRVIRAVNLRLGHLAETAGDLRDGTDAASRNQLADLEKQRDRILADAELDNLSRSKGGKQLAASLPSSDETLVATAAPGVGRILWRQLSSSAHVMDRGAYAAFALDQIVAIDDDRIRRSYAADALYGALIIAYQGIEHITRYLGGDAEALTASLPPLYTTWQRAGMSAEGHRLNSAIADAIMDSRKEA